MGLYLYCQLLLQSCSLRNHPKTQRLKTIIVSSEGGVGQVGWLCFRLQWLGSLCISCPSRSSGPRTNGPSRACSLHSGGRGAALRCKPISLYGLCQGCWYSIGRSKSHGWANVKSWEECPAFCGRGHQAAQQRVWIWEGCRTLRPSAPGPVCNSRKHGVAYVPGGVFLKMRTL